MIIFISSSSEPTSVAMPSAEPSRMCSIGSFERNCPSITGWNGICGVGEAAPLISPVASGSTETEAASTSSVEAARSASTSSGSTPRCSAKRRPVASVSSIVSALCAAPLCGIAL